VVLGLNAEQSLDEFIELSDSILEKQGMDAPARTAALRVYVDKLLEKYEIGKKTRLLETNICSKGSKMCVTLSSFQRMRTDEGQRDSHLT
jgi:hypothetical protein